MTVKKHAKKVDFWPDGFLNYKLLQVRHLAFQELSPVSQSTFLQHFHADKFIRNETILSVHF